MPSLTSLCYNLVNIICPTEWGLILCYVCARKLSFTVIDWFLGICDRAHCVLLLQGPNCARDNRQMVLATLGLAVSSLSDDPGRSNYYESLQVNHPTTPTTHLKLKRPRVWMSSRIRTCEIVRLWDGDISVCLTKSGQVDHKAGLVIGSETKLVMIESSYWGRGRE